MAHVSRPDQPLKQTAGQTRELPGEFQLQQLRLQLGGLQAAAGLQRVEPDRVVPHLCEQACVRFSRLLLILMLSLIHI
jgi:hypothetical protein